MIIHRIVSVTIMVLLLTVATGGAAESQKEKAATAVAQKWLVLVDDGKDAESWNEAAEYFRNTVTQEQWGQVMQAVRLPLGKLVSRKVKSAAYQTALPGAPDGEYVLIQFETVFENKKAAIETVTPMLEGNGEWRVSGYYIQ